jgi:cell filamentation protein
MNPIKGDLNFEHLLNILKYVFNDIYKWAGKTRSVNISKGNQFCNYAFIESMADEIFLKLHNDNYLIGLTNEQMIIKLSYYLGELNAMHPFREGNGRTQRIFIEYLANVAGYYVDFSKVSSKEMIEASSDSFLCDYKKMENIFRNIIDKITIDEQEMFIRSVAYKGSVFMKTFEYWKKNKVSK